MKREKIVIIMLSILLVTLLLLNIYQPGVFSPPTPKYSIQGYVVDASTLEPVKGATVKLTCRNRVEKELKTDSGGRFYFYVEEEAYGVYINKTGYYDFCGVADLRGGMFPQGIDWGRILLYPKVIPLG